MCTGICIESKEGVGLKDARILGLEETNDPTLNLTKNIRILFSET